MSFPSLETDGMMIIYPIWMYCLMQFWTLCPIINFFIFLFISFNLFSLSIIFGDLDMFFKNWGKVIVLFILLCVLFCSCSFAADLEDGSTFLVADDLDEDAFEVDSSFPYLSDSPPFLLLMIMML